MQPFGGLFPQMMMPSIPFHSMSSKPQRPPIFSSSVKFESHQPKENKSKNRRMGSLLKVKREASASDDESSDVSSSEESCVAEEEQGRGRASSFESDEAGDEAVAATLRAAIDPSRIVVAPGVAVKVDETKSKDLDRGGTQGGPQGMLVRRQLVDYGDVDKLSSDSDAEDVG